jgi:uncharacterized protein (TIGR02246 family)
MEIFEAIEEINTKFVDAINRGDAAAIAALYTEDCSVLVPNHATLRGRDEVRVFFQEMIEAVGGTTMLNIVETADAGKWAYQWADYTLTAGEITDSGRVVEVFRRDTEGVWKISLSIFNSSEPAS